MRTLIIHHLESIWESSYIKIGGITYEELVWKFREHLESENYDRVILTRFEENTLEPEHCIIEEFIDEVYDYAYGWPDDETTQGDNFCEGGSHSERVLLEEWMKNLKGEIYISGAFNGECLEDLEIALQHLKIGYTRVSTLII